MIDAPQARSAGSQPLSSGSRQDLQRIGAGVSTWAAANYLHPDDGQIDDNLKDRQFAGTAPAVP